MTRFLVRSWQASSICRNLTMMVLLTNQSTTVTTLTATCFTSLPHNPVNLPGNNCQSLISLPAICRGCHHKSFFFFLPEPIQDLHKLPGLFGLAGSLHTSVKSYDAWILTAHFRVEKWRMTSLKMTPFRVSLDQTSHWAKELHDPDLFSEGCRTFLVGAVVQISSL